MTVSRSAVAFVLACLFLGGCSDGRPNAASAAPAASTSTPAPTGVVPTVKKVFEWLVGFAEDVGKFIQKSAGTFSDALAAAWHAFWGDALVNKVRVSPDDPLRGKFDGELSCRVEWGQNQNGSPSSNHVSISLDHPQMVRASEKVTDWKLAPDEVQRIQSTIDNYLKP